MTSTAENQTSTDRIEKRVQLRAHRSRVWRALTDATEFGEWFRVKLDKAFTPGATVRGNMTAPGYEKFSVELFIERIEAERLFTYRWHPAAVNPEVDYSTEPTTLVEFHLEDAEGGTLLVIIETGFDALPASRRAEAFRMNEGGWTHQIKNIERHVSGS